MFDLRLFALGFVALFRSLFFGLFSWVCCLSTMPGCFCLVYICFWWVGPMAALFFCPHAEPRFWLDFCFLIFGVVSWYLVCEFCGFAGFVCRGCLALAWFWFWCFGFWFW